MKRDEPKPLNLQHRNETRITSAQPMLRDYPGQALRKGFRGPDQWWKGNWGVITSVGHHARRRIGQADAPAKSGMTDGTSMAQPADPACRCPPEDTIG
jgi:hypothetical protein